MMKGRSRAPVGEANGQTKLTPSQVKQIRAMHAAKMGRAKIAAAFGVAEGTIQKIYERKTWKHI